MEKKSKAIKIAVESWTEEKRSAFLYGVVAAKDKVMRHKKLFSRLAKEAEKQAQIWEEQIQKLGGKVPQTFKPDFRARIITRLIHLFGPEKIRPILAAMKVRGMSVYLQNEVPGHPMPKTVADVGRGHKNISSTNNLRAAVFGINDGLVSNLSLITGMVGANVDNKTIIIAGIAGLLAGAFSMGAGEYISVRSQREMFEYQIALEKKELELYPKEETAELTLIYHARGISKAEAFKIASMQMQNPKKALETLAREELGINPEDLVSPYGAAIFSFIFFMVGAVIPVLPFLFIKNVNAFIYAILLTGLSLFIVGCALSLFTGRNAIKSGLRMLSIGTAAGVITYLIGNLLDVKLR